VKPFNLPRKPGYEGTVSMSDATEGGHGSNDDFVREAEKIASTSGCASSSMVNPCSNFRLSCITVTFPDMQTGLGCMVDMVGEEDWFLAFEVVE
jgi:hypothetical protein